jgi:hypothetical protein
LPSSFLFLRKRYFYLFKVTVQGASLWHFHIYIYIYIYIYYNLNWFIPLFFSFLSYSAFYGDFYSLKILHSWIESTSTIITFLTSIFYPPFIICDLP